MSYICLRFEAVPGYLKPIHPQRPVPIIFPLCVKPLLWVSHLSIYETPGSDNSLSGILILCTEPVLELCVYKVYRQAHHIMIGALDAGNTNITYPFLYTVSTRFIKRLVPVDVKAYLRIGKRAKRNQGMVIKHRIPFPGDACRHRYTPRVCLLTSGISSGRPQLHQRVY